MNVAEDVRNALAGERDLSGGTGFVEAEVESLAVKERKDVVKERIGIWEEHNTADGND
jgi:hypothetical protein